MNEEELKKAEELEKRLKNAEEKIEVLEVIVLNISDQLRKGYVITDPGIN